MNFVRLFIIMEPNLHS